MQKIKFYNQKKAYFLALLAVLLWSFSATAFKITLKYVTYNQLIWVSVITSLLVFEMGFTFVIWYYALYLSETTAKVNNLIYFTPFLSLIFISLIIKEKILISTIVGLILILSGIIYQNKK